MVTQSEHRVWFWYIWLVGSVAAAVLLWASISLWNRYILAPSSESAIIAVSGTDTQSNEEGQVTVKVTWNGINTGPVFEIVMDTHAVDLDGVDLKQLAVLRVDGNEVSPSTWDAPKGGHHRSGTLTFPTRTTDGKPLITRGTNSIELSIRDVAGVSNRVFLWKP